ncbi:hypothetical protein N8T08_000945 [Aspergillus melleus]|uniref:Uncharacterized protein n=1 Tax=Aspergillus melleus TaxID=138277 RepID=A0ACC3BAB0_9EURO|nr:hypothetical protein N8T08_000945 [Aspergillus melleus]
MAKLVPLKSGYYVWQYVPSLPAAIIFLILFLATTAFHFWKIFRTRVRFTIPFALGGIFEIIGYAARIHCHDNTGALVPYCIQAVFVLLAPALFAASVYMILGRIIRAVRAEHLSIIRVGWLTKTFVVCDVLTFLIQASGSGMMVNDGLTNLGQNIVIAGLVLQVLCFGLFMVTALIFQRRLDRTQTPEAANHGIPWRQHLNSLYAISTLIMVRSIFRVIEYALGNDGYLLSNEWPLYIFDSVPMFFAMVILAYSYPDELRPFLQGISSSSTAALEPKA